MALSWWHPRGKYLRRLTRTSSFGPQARVHAHTTRPAKAFSVESASDIRQMDKVSQLPSHLKAALMTTKYRQGHLHAALESLSACLHLFATLALHFLSSSLILSSSPVLANANPRSPISPSRDICRKMKHVFDFPPIYLSVRCGFHPKILPCIHCIAVFL